VGGEVRRGRITLKMDAATLITEFLELTGLEHQTVLAALIRFVVETGEMEVSSLRTLLKKIEEGN